MRRPLSRSAARPTNTTRRTTGDTAAVLVRAGDKVLGSVARLAGGDVGDRMSGSFTHRPSFVDYAEMFQRLQTAIETNDPTDDIRAEIEAAGIEVWHSINDMRLDRPQSIEITGGEVHFRPNDAFVMMRTGGL